MKKIMDDKLNELRQEWNSKIEKKFEKENQMKEFNDKVQEQSKEEIEKKKNNFDMKVSKLREK
jgi:hypothetical protein